MLPNLSSLSPVGVHLEGGRKGEDVLRDYYRSNPNSSVRIPSGYISSKVKEGKGAVLALKFNVVALEKWAEVCKKELEYDIFKMQEPLRFL